MTAGEYRRIIVAGVASPQDAPRCSATFGSAIDSDATLQAIPEQLVERRAEQLEARGACMHYGSHPGWIEVISGVMFSGKSEELIRRVRRGIIARRRVQVFKSHLDSRYVGHYSVISHNGAELEAAPVDSAAEIFRLARPDIEIVAIDETQFLDPNITKVATLLAERGVRVIMAGTDTDFRGEPFGPMGELMAIAEIVDKLHAICVICGDLACRNQRLINGRPARYDSPTIMIGGRESYEARCRHCHRVPKRDEDQTALL